MLLLQLLNLSSLDFNLSFKFLNLLELPLLVLGQGLSSTRHDLVGLERGLSLVRRHKILVLGRRVERLLDWLERFLVYGGGDQGFVLARSRLPLLPTICWLKAMLRLRLSPSTVKRNWSFLLKSRILLLKLSLVRASEALRIFQLSNLLVLIIL